jgi:hypothetical protein
MTFTKELSKEMGLKSLNLCWDINLGDESYIGTIDAPE